MTFTTGLTKGHMRNGAARDSSYRQINICSYLFFGESDIKTYENVFPIFVFYLQIVSHSYVEKFDHSLGFCFSV